MHLLYILLFVFIVAYLIGMGRAWWVTRPQPGGSVATSASAAAGERWWRVVMIVLWPVVFYVAWRHDRKPAPAPAPVATPAAPPTTAAAAAPASAPPAASAAPQGDQTQ